jgi:hypothetical protein
MEGPERSLSAAVRTELAAELSRRDFLRRAGVLGAGATVLAALPLLERTAQALTVPPLPLTGGTLQAFYDTIIPGKPVPGLETELGNPIHPRAIAGVDAEQGAVFTDALALGQNPKIGFNALAPPFLAELESLAVLQGGTFIDLDFESRERVCKQGFAFSNPTRQLWEAGAAVAFTAFCAAANIRNATAKTAAGYAVMGFPGAAPHGYSNFSYGRRLSEERTADGNPP